MNDRGHVDALLLVLVLVAFTLGVIVDRTLLQ